jgi:hypothetical protein
MAILLSDEFKHKQNCDLSPTITVVVRVGVEPVELTTWENNKFCDPCLEFYKGKQTEVPVLLYVSHIPSDS